jgi:hypothetical protein
MRITGYQQTPSSLASRNWVRFWRLTKVASAELTSGWPAQLKPRSVRRQQRCVIGDAIRINWAGLLLFAALGCFFLQKALRREAARRWGWGRTGEAAPLSRPSYALWGLTFLVIAATLASAPKIGALPVALFIACFLALGVAGVLDTRAEQRRRDSR